MVAHSIINLQRLTLLPLGFPKYDVLKFILFLKGLCPLSQGLKGKFTMNI